MYAIGVDSWPDGDLHYPLDRRSLLKGMHMRTWVSAYQKLRWKLTLSYSAVTVGALLVVVLILGSLLLSRVLVPSDLISSALTPTTWVQSLRNEAQDLFRYILSQEPINTELIAFLLQKGDLQVSSFDLLRVGDLELRLRTVGEGFSMLLDPNGILLGVSNPDFVAQDAVGRLLDTEILPGLAGPLEAALGGELDAGRLFVSLETNERFYAVAPLLDASGQVVLGVVIAYVEHLPTEGGFSSNLLALLGRSALILLVSAGLVGLLFGFLTAQGMVKRLQHASDVTDAWSRGDFSEFIDDPVSDEIGNLGERLNRMARQLNGLLKRREEIAILEERNRLARDLHDSAKQQAFAASFQIGTALTLFDRDPLAARGHLEEAEQLVNSVRGELTDLIMELRPQDMEDKSIGEILSEYAIDWAQQHGFELDQNIEKDLPLSIGSKQTLFRILQEALANVARHSEGTQISLRLASDGDEVTMILKDNGKGFSPEEAVRGIGLHSMLERAESANGSMELITAPGQGTSISVRIPRVE